MPKDEKTEPFLSLRNAYKFLHASSEYGIDLILHGHKHVSWTSVYKAHPNALSVMLVSACGTSAKPEEIEREFRLYLVDSNGVVRKRDYATSKAFNGFKSPLGVDDSLVGYGEVRKQSNVRIVASPDTGVRSVSKKPRW